jgi:hypothetical protein
MRLNITSLTANTRITTRAILNTALKHKWYVAGAAGLATLLFSRKTVPAKLDYITNNQRADWFGPITFISAPTDNNPEGIRIINDFENRNIIRKTFPIIGIASIHKEVAPSLEEALKEIERKGWSNKIKTFEGGYYPRFVRNSRINLSSHSYGTAVDINAASNPQGNNALPDQYDIDSVMKKHGWYWGINFPTVDPHHWEYVIKPKGII